MNKKDVLPLPHWRSGGTSTRVGRRTMQKMAACWLIEAPLLLWLRLCPSCEAVATILWSPSSAILGAGLGEHELPSNILDNIVQHWKHFISRRKRCKKYSKPKFQFCLKYEFIWQHCKFKHCYNVKSILILLTIVFVIVYNILWTITMLTTALYCKQYCW